MKSIYASLLILASLLSVQATSDLNVEGVVSSSILSEATSNLVVFDARGQRHEIQMTSTETPTSRLQVNPENVLQPAVLIISGRK